MRVGVRVGVGGWGVIRVGVEGNWVGPGEGGRKVEFICHSSISRLPDVILCDC